MGKHVLVIHSAGDTHLALDVACSHLRDRGFTVLEVQAKDDATVLQAIREAAAKFGRETRSCGDCNNWRAYRCLVLSPDTVVPPTQGACESRFLPRRPKGS